MRRSTPKPIRNKLDLSDRVQMRLIRKRLGLSDAELTAIVGRIGNSISAISKEVAQHRVSAVSGATDVPPAPVITSATANEPPATEIALVVPTS
jgi:hypothetical protein